MAPTTQLTRHLPAHCQHLPGVPAASVPARHRTTFTEIHPALGSASAVERIRSTATCRQFPGHRPHGQVDTCIEGQHGVGR